MIDVFRKYNHKYNVFCEIFWNNFSFKFPLALDSAQGLIADYKIVLVADSNRTTATYTLNNGDAKQVSVEVKKIQNTSLKVDFQSILELKYANLLDGPLRGEFNLRGFEMMCYAETLRPVKKK